MKGQLIKRSEGSWSIVLYLGRDPITGKKRKKWYTYRGNKKEAEKELTRLVYEVNTGAYVEPAKLTLAEYLQRWLNDYAKTNVGGKTLERYEEIVSKHLVPALGSMLLCNLKPLHIQSYYSQALQNGRLKRKKQSTEKCGLEPQTVLHHHRVLREALAQAVRWQLLIRNPADAVEPPKPEPKEMHALDEAQTAWLLEVAKGTRFYVPVLLAVTSGMRRGEFLALRWKDLNIERGVVSVMRSVQQTKARIDFKAPKGRKGRNVRKTRSIVLLPLTLEALTQHREIQDRQKERLGSTYEDEDLICARENGSLWKPNTFSSDFARLAKKAGLKGVRLHDMRHSHATQLLINGIHPKVVSERLGHSTVGITLDIYSHVLPGLQEDAAMKLDRALRSAIKDHNESRVGPWGSTGVANRVT